MIKPNKKFIQLKRKQFIAFKQALTELSYGSESLPEVAHDRIREIAEQSDILEYAINGWYADR